jgi:hypothetical protein
MSSLVASFRAIGLLLVCLYASTVAALPTWNINSVSYSLNNSSTGGSAPHFKSVTLNTDAQGRLPLGKDKAGEDVFLKVLYQGGSTTKVIGEFKDTRFLTFDNTEMLALALKTPADADKETEAFKQSINNALGTFGVTDKTLTLAQYLFELVPFDGNRADASGKFEVKGTVKAGPKEAISQFSARADGTLYSQGRFADAILGNTQLNDEAIVDDQSKESRADFQYPGNEKIVKQTSGDQKNTWIFQRTGTARPTTDFLGDVTFKALSATLLEFEITHIIGGFLGASAGSSTYPQAGGILDDLKLSVRSVSEPPLTALLMFGGWVLLAHLRSRRGAHRRRFPRLKSD